MAKHVAESTDIVKRKEKKDSSWVIWFVAALAIAF